MKPFAPILWCRMEFCGLAISLAALAGGCGAASRQLAITEPATVPESRADQGQGGAWEAVMYTPALANRVEDDSASLETRRDDALVLRVPLPLLATNQWPEPPRPSVLRTRTINLPRNPESLLVFLPGYRWYEHDRSWRHEPRRSRYDDGRRTYSRPR
ncbi:MAG: hypothetical protein H7Y88_00720 [Phycisphaerales bacterium]|nr:hypothetical protein [Phycisphaerales bacterium]